MSCRRLLIAPLALLCTFLLWGGSAGATAPTTPTLTSPAASSVNGGAFTVAYTLPAAPNGGDVTLTFDNGVDTPLQYQIVSSNTSESFTFFTANPGASGLIASGAGTPLPDGVYSVTLSYQSSSDFNTYQSTNTGVVVDSTTKPPSMTSPADYYRGTTIPVSFSLPETPTAGSIQLSIVTSGAGTACSLVLTNVAKDAVQSFTLDPASPASSPEVASVSPSCSIPDGDYDVALTYQDSYGNPAGMAYASPVTVDRVTQAPALTSPASDTSITGAIGVQYSLPEAALAGSVQLKFEGPSTSTLNLSATGEGDHSLSIDRAALAGTAGVDSVTGDAALANGAYAVTISYRDDLGNPIAAGTSATNVTLTAPPKSDSPPAAAAKNCLEPISSKVKIKVKGKAKKLKISSAVSGDGQSMTIKIAKVKGVKTSLKVDGVGRPAAGSYIVTVANSRVVVTFKAKKIKKTLALPLTTHAC